MFHKNAFKRKKKEIKIVIQNDELKADDEEAHKPFLSKAAERSRTDGSLDAAFFLFDKSRKHESEQIESIVNSYLFTQTAFLNGGG